MPIGGVGNDAGATRGLAQHHGVGPPVAGQFDARFDQRTTQVAMAVGAARLPRRDVAALGRHRRPASSPNRSTLAVDIGSHVCYAFVDSVHKRAVATNPFDRRAVRVRAGTGIGETDSMTTTTPYAHTEP